MVPIALGSKVTVILVSHLCRVSSRNVSTTCNGYLSLGLKKMKPPWPTTEVSLVYSEWQWLPRVLEWFITSCLIFPLEKTEIGPSPCQANAMSPGCSWQ